MQKRYVLIDKPNPIMPQASGGLPTGVVLAFDYIIGLAVFGLVWFIFDDPLNLINTSIVVDNADWAMMLWRATLVFYLVFGAFYFLNGLKQGDME